MNNLNLVKTEIINRIGYIILNRPEKRNALDGDMISQLTMAFQDFFVHHSVKVIILKAEGKAFCSGADLASLQKMQDNTYEENLNDSQQLKALFHLIYTGPKVVIAQIQGHALAGGCGLASICDFSFAAEGVLLGYTEVRIGFVPALVSLFLIRKIGEGAARKLLISAELIDAHKAQQLGVINEVVKSEELEQKVLQFAEELIQQNSSQAMAITKQMLAELRGLNLDQSLNYAAEQNAKARETEDCKRGVSAFLNKQQINW
jgi:methylglutaconyl-CoA hydratase